MKNRPSEKKNGPTKSPHCVNCGTSVNEGDRYCKTCTPRTLVADGRTVYSRLPVVSIMTDDGVVHEAAGLTVRTPQGDVRARSIFVNGARVGAR